jgi:hypothetical protein
VMFGILQTLNLTWICCMSGSLYHSPVDRPWHIDCVRFSVLSVSVIYRACKRETDYFPS